MIRVCYVGRVGWVERSDTHHVLGDGDGFREGLNPSYDLLPEGLFAKLLTRIEPPAARRHLFINAIKPRDFSNDQGK
jgi:hypothetical protein